MDIKGQRSLQVLREVEKNSTISQRSLAKKLGVAVGLTNLYLKRLARKGYIKVTTLPKSRIRYLLTPHGLAEKSRLTYEYFQYSLTYYRDVRQRFQHLLNRVEHSGAKRIVIFGIGEIAELAYLSILDRQLTFVGFITNDNEAPRRFLSYPCGATDSLHNWDFDAILISELNDVEEIKKLLQASGVPNHKVFSVV